MAISRSSASRFASSAPSQRMAGPIRASSARSGPSANGTSVTTIRKNSTPIQAPPPTRTASLISRRRMAERALMPAAPGGERIEQAAASSSDPQSQLLGLVEADRSMRRGQDQPAAGEMNAHELRQHGLAQRCRAPWSARRAARSAARPQSGGQATAGGAARRRDSSRAAGPVRRDRRPTGLPLPWPPFLGRISLGRSPAEKLRPECEVLAHR